MFFQQVGAVGAGLLGAVNLALASLSLMEEGAALRLPRLGLLRAWLVLAFLNIGAVAFLLVCLLDVLKDDEGVNLAMAFGSIFTVMTTGSSKGGYSSIMCASGGRSGDGVDTRRGYEPKMYREEIF